MLRVLQLPKHSFTLLAKKTFHHSLPLNPFLPFEAKPVSTSLTRHSARTSVFSVSSVVWMCVALIVYSIPSIGNFHMLSYISMCFYSHMCAFSLPNSIISPRETSYLFVLPTFKIVLKTFKWTRQVFNTYNLTGTSFNQIKILFILSLPQNTMDSANILQHGICLVCWLVSLVGIFPLY